MKYSVIVVNYNNEKYLNRCLDSIMNQTYKNFELIIVDDGSTDKSRDIINSYKKYENVTVYFKENTGIADARNFAIQKVKTKYFTFVDSDDYIDSELLERCSKYDNYDMVSFGCYYVYPKLRKDKVEKNAKGEFQSKNGEEVLEKYIEKLCLFLVPWGYMYNVELFKELSYVVNYIHEDVYLTTLLILKSKKTISLDYCGYYYVQSKESITRTKNEQKMREKMKSMLYNFDYLKEYFIKNIKDANLRKIYIGYYANLLLSTGNDFSRRVKNDFCDELEKRKLYDDFNTDVFPEISKPRYRICKRSFKAYYKIYSFMKVVSPIYYKIRDVYYFFKYKVFMRALYFIYYRIIKGSYYFGLRCLRFTYYRIIRRGYHFGLRVLRFIYYRIVRRGYHFGLRVLRFIYHRTINRKKYSMNSKRKSLGDQNVEKKVKKRKK